MVEKIVRIPTNFVLVEVDSLFHETIVFDNDKKLLFDPTYEPEKHSQVSGIVHKTPDALYFNLKDLEFSANQNIAIEAQEGDRIYFHYLQINSAISNNLIYPMDGKMFIFVRYDSCFCVVREKEIIMLNGWMLLSPVPEKEQLKSDIIDIHLPFHRRKPSAKIGIIAEIGIPVEQYLWTKHESDKGIEVKKGDKVVFSPHSDIPLEYDMHQQLNSVYFRVQRKDLLGRYDTI